MTGAATQWTALGCQARVVTTHAEAIDAARAIAERELAAIDLACSRFRADSELRSFDDAEGASRPVSALLAEAVQVALRAAEVTEGALDPTVGTAMIAAGYDRDFATISDRRPGAEPAVRAVVTSDWRAIDLDAERRTLTLPPGTKLDLGATAKAWAADRVATRIAAELGCGVLVSLGGDVATAGPAPATGWHVRVQDATGDVDADPIGSHQDVTVRSGGLATSGSAARRWTRGGVRMHHIIDPRTSRPARSPWRTVSVAAPSCAQANVASTATMVRGDEALAWLRRTGLPVRLVDHSGAIRTLGAWPAVTS